MRLLSSIAPALTILTLAACSSTTNESVEQADAGRFRIEATPGGRGGNCAPGEHRLDLGGGRFAYLRVNPGGTAAHPFLLALHGAGSGARGGLYAFRGGWSARGLVLLAPAAEGTTWSALRGTDTDLVIVERALRRAFARCRIDPARIAVGGFSDGATYALTLGLANGRLFRSVIALSAGGILGDDFTGNPRVFVAHGTKDNVLPIAQTSDVIVRELRTAGYRVTYVRFAAGHKVLASVSRRSIAWFLRR
jgi:phospholipase/carboxylesterase